MSVFTIKLTRYIMSTNPPYCRVVHTRVTNTRENGNP